MVIRCGPQSNSFVWMRKHLALFICFSAMSATGFSIPSNSLKKEVIKNYSMNVFRNYQEVLKSGEYLKKQISYFTKNPDSSSFEAAKRAWLAAREDYGLTEAFRFYDGPIDHPKNGREGHINAWPLDEAYLDYVKGNPKAGIINHQKIKISKSFLTGANEGGAGDILKSGPTFDPEKAIATGYHAIEFLLWGQDHQLNGPGNRPWQDYLDGKGATHPNGSRRAQTLNLITDILVEDIGQLVKSWDPSDPKSYYHQFHQFNPDDALRKILSGIGILAKGELAGERIDVALDTLDQEDEHSCFSDNTHRDIQRNLQGIANVYFGSFGPYRGPGLNALLSQADQNQFEFVLKQAQIAAGNLVIPFDHALLKRNSDAWIKAQETVRRLYLLGNEISILGQKTGIGQVRVHLPG